MSSSMSMRRKRSTPAAMMACRSTKRPPSGMIACTSRKRRRPQMITAAATSESESDASSWAYLQGDLVRVIGCRLLDGDGLLDYVRFRAVCTHWRSCTVSPRGRGIIDPRFLPRRWVMLPEGHGLHPGHAKLGGYVRFFNLSTAAIVRATLPIFDDHCIHDSVDGLLLLQRKHDNAIRLLNPLTGDIAELPPLRKYVSPELGIFANTSFSVSADGVIIVMVAVMKRVAFATTRGHKWHLSSLTLPSTRVSMSLQGKMYFVNTTTSPSHDSSETQVFQIDTPQHDGMGSGSSSLPPPKLIATCRIGKTFIPLHLAECDSQILLIGASDHCYSHIAVYKLTDLILHRVVPITSIGDNVLLIGEKFLSVSSMVLPNIAGDSIVTFNCCSGNSYFGLYNLSTATWSPAADGWSSVEGGPVRCRDDIPNPVSLIYHIFTCCQRSAWNTGRIGKMAALALRPESMPKMGWFARQYGLEGEEEVVTRGKSNLQHLDSPLDEDVSLLTKLRHTSSSLNWDLASPSKDVADLSLAPEVSTKKRVAAVIKVCGPEAS